MAPEVEGEFIQVVLQMLMTHRSLVRADEPSLKERCDSVYTWHQFRSRSLCVGNFGHVVLVSLLVQTGISLPAVGMNNTPWFNGIRNEWIKAGGLGILYRLL